SPLYIDDRCYGSEALGKYACSRACARALEARAAEARAPSVRAPAASPRASAATQRSSRATSTTPACPPGSGDDASSMEAGAWQSFLDAHAPYLRGRRAEQIRALGGYRVARAMWRS